MNSLFLNRITLQRHGGFIHPTLHPLTQNVIHVAEDPVVFLCPDDKIKVRDTIEKLFPAALGHTSHEPINDMTTPFAVLPHHSHLTQRFLLGLISH